MSVREFRIQGRKADGSPCCQTNDVSDLCDDCRARNAADGSVPAARRLSDALNKDGAAPTPGKVNQHGVPRPQTLAEAVQARGGRR